MPFQICFHIISDPDGEGKRENKPREFAVTVKSSFVQDNFVYKNAIAP